jgi:hypothetical protein
LIDEVWHASANNSRDVFGDGQTAERVCDLFGTQPQTRLQWHPCASPPDFQPLFRVMKPAASISLDLDNLWSYLKTQGAPGWESFPSYLDSGRAAHS